MKIIKSNVELKNSYIAFLAIHDLWNLARGRIEDKPEKLLSEKELAFIENKKLNGKRLFTTNRLKNIFQNTRMLNPCSRVYFFSTCYGK